MALYVGTDKVKDLYIGASRVKAIYKGTDLLYFRGLPVLFDSGWVTGVSWSGNTLPRQNYTSQGTYSFDRVESDGYMELTINAASYNYSYNAHVCTAAHVTVPADATKMKITVDRGPNQCYCKFGLLPDNCPNSMDTGAGGQLSELFTPGYGENTYELDLAEGMAGSDSFKAVINIKATHVYAYMRITKVWFE